MTAKQSKQETKYLITRCVLKQLLKEHLISETDFKQRLKNAAEQYHSMIGELEVNSYVGKENHYN